MLLTAQTALTPLERFIQTAAVAGCPRDQLENFLRAGYIPQPKQLEFHAAARLADLPDGPDKIALGGARGPGKSHGILAQVGMDDCQRMPESKWLFIRKKAGSARESFEDLIVRVLRGVKHNYVPSRSVLEFPNGSRIVLGGFLYEKEIDGYLGIEYDGIIIEEATLLSKMKVEMLLGSLRTSKSNWRPRLYISFNPGGVGHAHIKATYVKPFREGREADTRFISSTYRDNAFINPEYRRYLEGLTGWLGKAWRDGNMDIAAGQYFTNWNHDIHVIRPFDIPRDWHIWAAMDYGFTHYTVVYLLAVDGDGNVYVVAEHAERRWLPEQHAAAIKSMATRYLGGLHRVSSFVAGGDVFAKRETGSTVADQYAAHGIQLSMADTSRIDGWARILQMLGDSERGIPPKLFIFERCARLIECMPSLEHDPNRPEDVLKVDTDDDGNGGDDPGDTLRYGVMSMPGSPVQVDVQNWA